MASSDGDVEMESPKAEKKEQTPPSEETAESSKEEKPTAPAKDEKPADDKKDAPKPSEIPRLATSELTIDEIPIGRGGYGYVYRATHEMFGTVAIKTMISDGILPMRHQRVFQAEGKKLWQLSQANIVQLLALIMEEGNYSLVLEYMHLGSLTAFLTDFPSTAPCLRVCILRDIAAGMAYLHTLNPPILHLDLKSDNILINRFIRAKITDFGLAQWKTMTRTMTGRQLASTAGARAGAAAGAGGAGTPAAAEGDTDTITGRRGTVTHVPPEVWSNVNTPPNMAYDVYGFGIVIWETMTGEKPFGVVKEDIIPKAVLSGQRPDLSAIPKACPKAISSLMKTCWEQQANKRPKFPGILSDIEACFRSIAAQVRKALEELEREIQTLYSPEDLGGDTHFTEQSESLLDLAEVTIPKKLADIDRKLEEKKKAEEEAKAAKLAAAASASSTATSTSSSSSSSAKPSTSSAAAEPAPKAKTTLDQLREDPEYRARLLRQVLRDPVQLFIMEQDPTLLKNAFQIDDSIHTFLRDPDEMKKVFEEDPHLKYEMMRRGFDYLGWLYTPQGCRAGFRKKFPKRMSKPHLIEDQAKKIREQEEAERKREEDSMKRRQEYMRESHARRLTIDTLSDMLHMPRQQILRQIAGLLENPPAFQRFMNRRPYPGSVDPRLEEILQDPEAMLSVLQSEPRLLEMARKEDPDILQTLYRASTRRGGPKSRMMHPLMLERGMRGMDLDEDDMDEMMMGPSSLRAQMMMMEHPMMRTMREMSDPMGPMGMSKMRGPSGRYMEEMYGDSMEDSLPGKPPQKKAFMSRLKDKMFRSLSHKEEEAPGMRPAPEHIQVVQEDIGGDWKKLAEKLGMSPKFCERLEEETHNFPDQSACIKEMLTTWSRWSNATFENMAKALRQINRHDVANKMVGHKVKPLPWNSTTASATATSSTATTSTASSSSATSSTAAKDSKTGSSVDPAKK